MVGDLSKFAAFLLVPMVSFALAFYALFFTCDEDAALTISFGTLGDSLVTVFDAALGQFDFDEFNSASEACNRPTWTLHIGIFMLIVYLIIMVVVMMNLLIAVRSNS